MEQQISLSEAQALVARLKENPVDGLPVSETFGAEIIDAITGQDDFSSLRVYFGQKEDGSICAILAGLDNNGNELTGVLGEDGFRCPPLCPPASLINP